MNSVGKRGGWKIRGRRGAGRNFLAPGERTLPRSSPDPLSYTGYEDGTCQNITN